MILQYCAIFSTLCTKIFPKSKHFECFLFIILIFICQKHAFFCFILLKNIFRYLVKFLILFLYSVKKSISLPLFLQFLIKIRLFNEKTAALFIGLSPFLQKGLYSYSFCVLSPWLVRIKRNLVKRGNFNHFNRVINSKKAAHSHK